MKVKSYRLILTLSIVLLTALVIFTGCGKKDKTVAKVGDFVITASEFKDGFISRYRTEENAQKQSFKERMEFLDTIIDKKLKIADAYAKGLDKSEDIVQAGKEAQERIAVQQKLFEVEIVDKIITEKSLKEYYGKMGEEIQARHILVKSTPTDTVGMEAAKVKADSIRNLLNTGGDFVQLAQELSDDKSNAAKGGDLGWFGWGRMVEEFQAAAFALSKDQISDPVASPFGWHIIQLLDRRPTDMKPYAEEKDKLREDMKRARWSEIRTAADEYLAKLKEDRGLVYKEDVLEQIFERVQKSTAPQNVSLFSDFTEEDKKMAVAEWSGGEVTVADLDEKIGGQGAGITESKIFKDVIDGILIPEILADKAKEIGVYESKEALDAARLARENKMIVEVERLAVEDKINTDDATLMAYYEANLDQYVTDQKVTIREILVSDKKLASELLKKGKNGANWAKLAKKNTERENAKKDGGKIGPFGSKRYGQMGREALKLNVGEFCDEPVKMGRKYSVFKVEEKIDAKQQTFEEARKNIERNYKMEKTQEFKDNWVAELKNNYPVKIYEDNLRNCMPFVKMDPPSEEDKKAGKGAEVKELNKNNPHAGTKPVNPHKNMKKADKPEAGKTGEKKEKSN